MARPKSQIDRPKHATLQVPPIVKVVLKKEQVRRQEQGDGFVPMGEILVEALADHFSDRPEYMKILREAGLLH